MTPTKRRTLNFVLSVTSALTLISGVFLLFHVHSRPIVGIHQFGGLIFAGASLVHLRRNWRPLLVSLTGRFPSRGAVPAIAAGTAGMYFTRP